MQTSKTAEKTIRRIGGETIAGAGLYKAIYKNLDVRHKMNRKINTDHIHEHITEKTLLYHPFWMVKNLIMAERPPFPPKKIPRVIFVDAVSGYRGLFSHVPPITEEETEAGRLTEAQIKSEEEVEKYIKDVQVKQINRSYMLKKPQHEIKETSLVYLPVWKVKIESAELEGLFYINGNTGESEQFISERWWNGKDLLE